MATLIDYQKAFNALGYTSNDGQPLAYVSNWEKTNEVYAKFWAAKVGTPALTATTGAERPSHIDPKIAEALKAAGNCELAKAFGATCSTGTTGGGNANTKTVTGTTNPAGKTLAQQWDAMVAGLPGGKYTVMGVLALLIAAPAVWWFFFRKPAKPAVKKKSVPAPKPKTAALKAPAKTTAAKPKKPKADKAAAKQAKKKQAKAAKTAATKPVAVAEKKAAKPKKAGKNNGSKKAA